MMITSHPQSENARISGTASPIGNRSSANVQVRFIISGRQISDSGQLSLSKIRTSGVRLPLWRANSAVCCYAQSAVDGDKESRLTDFLTTPASA